MLALERQKAWHCIAFTRLLQTKSLLRFTKIATWIGFAFLTTPYNSAGPWGRQT
jgi:hypothetical protein